MRLFIAINLNEKMKNTLCDTMQRLKQHAAYGNFTPRENLHLTLVFIGETERSSLIKQVMDGVQMNAFPLKIKGFGRFKRDEGNIYWAGIERSESLEHLYRQLYLGLSKAGFSLDNREFSPHLTLGRKVVLQQDFDKEAFQEQIPQMEMAVNKISLMKSQRMGHRQVYTELFAKKLQ